MSVRWCDVTVPMRPEMAVWPGDPPFRFEALGRVAEGAGSNTSLVTMCTHTGTHIDAPWHFCEEGRRLDEVDPSVFFGRATLVDVGGVDLITAADLDGIAFCDRVLFMTRNSVSMPEEDFWPGYAALAADAAECLVQAGVRLVGVDGPSVAPYKQADQATHRILLGNDVLVVESLRFSGLEAGECWFTVLPLALTGSDGAPCRAFVGLEVEEGNL